MSFRLCAAVLAFAAAAALTGFAFSLRAGHFAPEWAWVGIAAGLVAAAAAFVQSRPPAPARRWGWTDGLVGVAFALFAVRAFCWLLYWERDSLRVGLANNIGDICRHILYERMFAAGDPLWPEHPLHAWEMLRYYPGMDFLQAMGMAVGGDEFRLLVWSGLVGSLLAALALRAWGGAFAQAGFLFAGGFAGFAVLAGGEWKDWQMTLAWKPLPTAIFVAQRGFLFALPAVVMLLCHWRAKLFPALAAARAEPASAPSRYVPTVPSWREEHGLAATAVPMVEPVAGDSPPRGLLPLWLEVVLIGALAFFQLYAFLFVVGLLGWWGLAYAGRSPVFRHVSIVLGLSAALAVPLAALETNFFAPGSSFFRWHPGWMMEPKDSFLGFWLMNFGLSLPVAAALWARMAVGRWLDAPRRGVPAAEAFVIPAGLCFLACCFFAFAPWEWDNTKLMIWSWLVVLPFLAEWLAPQMPAALRWAGCIALFFSGAVSLLAGLRAFPAGVEIGRRGEIELLGADLDRAGIPRSARFAAAPEYNHPLVLNGRRLAMGYDGHLHGYGLDYSRLRQEVDTLMLGRPGWRGAARRLGVTHIYWGPREQRRYAKSQRPWESAGGQPIEGEWGKVWPIPPGSAAP